MICIDVYGEEFQGDFHRKLIGMLVQDLLDFLAGSLAHAYCYEVS